MSAMTQADRILSDIYDLRERDVGGWEDEKTIEKEWDEIFTRIAVYLGARDRNTWLMHRGKGPE